MSNVLTDRAPDPRHAAELLNLLRDRYLKIIGVARECPPGRNVYGSPEADEQWRQWRADWEERLRGLQEPYADALDELRTLTEGLLNAAALLALRGSPLNLSELRRILTILPFCKDGFAPFPDIDEALSQLDDLERRLRLAGSVTTDGNGSPPQGEPDWRMIEQQHGPSRMTHVDMAERFGVDPEALRGRLRRWREDNPGQSGKGWWETPDRGPRDPGHTYLVSAVLPIVRKLHASGIASGERPAKK